MAHSDMAKADPYPQKLSRISFPFSRILRWGAALLLGGVILVAAAVFITYQFQQYTGRLQPNTFVVDIPVGKYTVEEAAEKVAQVYNQDRQIIYSMGEQKWVGYPNAIGLNVQAQATVELAFALGYEQSRVDGIRQMLGWGDASVVVAPLVVLDAEKAAHALEGLATLVYVPPQNASLAYSDGQVLALPGVNGRQLDIPATLDAISHDPRVTLISGVIPLLTQPVLPVVQTLPPHIFAQAQQILAQPLVVQAYDPVEDDRLTWEVDVETLAEWVSVGMEGGEMVLTVDVSGAETGLAELTAQLSDGEFLEPGDHLDAILAAVTAGTPATLRVMHEPSTYTVQARQTMISVAWEVGIPYWRLLDANPGFSNTTIYEGLELNIPSVDVNLPLPIVPGKRLIVDISEQHLWGYENGELVIDQVISTGISDSPTQPGVFQAQSHYVNAYASNWDLWMPHFIGIYEAWPGFVNGFHGLPTLSSGQILWAGSLGRPASYGCIILNLGAAERLFTWAEPGVVVEIRN